jgi:tetratricopeptide (TPR) repeat protein
MSTSEIAKLESRWRDNPQGLTFAPLAEAYRKQKDARRALEILTPGLERHPDYIPANIVLGRCHWDLDDLEAAEKAFTHVLTLDSENVIALKALADITERLSRPSEAERWLETLLAIDRSNDEARDQLARIRAVQSVSPQIETPAGLGFDPVVIDEPPGDAAPEAEPPTFIEPLVTEPEPHAYAPPPALASDPFPPIADHMRPGKIEPGDVGLLEPRETFDPFPADPPDEAPPAPSRADDFPSYDEAPAAPPEPAPESEGFRFERAEEIVLNPSGGSEFHTPDLAGDLMPADSAATIPADEPETESSLYEAPPSPAALFGPYSPEEPETPPPSDPPTPAPAGSVGYQAYEVPAADLVTAGEPPQPAEPDTAEPDLVVTETMAQVFLRQGHVVEALAVYRELSSRDPESERLRERVAELEARRVAMAAPPPRPSFLARDTGGQSLGTFFAALLAARPAGGPAPVDDGFGGVELSPETAPATRPAEEPLSLGSVFGEDPPAMAPAVPPASAGPEAPPADAPSVSFDDFFAGAQVPAPAPVAPARAPRAKPDDDLDQFHTWLQGLKR